VYLRADPGDMVIVDGEDTEARNALLALRLREWRAISG
jgi:hypothetical protein